MANNSSSGIRSHDRYVAKKGLIAALVISDTDIIKGSIVNLSRGGAYVQTSKPVPDTLKTVTFQRADGSSILNVPCKFKPGRHDIVGNGCAITFLDYLSPEDLNDLCSKHSNSKSLDLVKNDFNTVNQEIEYARNSRMKIFIVLSVCLNTWLFGAAAFGITNNLNATIWLATATAAAVPAALLATGILLHSIYVNFMNVRKAFLAVLSYYLRNEIIPPGYLGWGHLSINQHSCNNRIKQGLCQKKDNFCSEYNLDQTKKYALFGGIFNSTGKTIGLIYSILFLISSSILTLVLFKYANTILAICIGGLSLFIFGYLSFYAISLSKGARSIESYYIQWKKILLNCCPVLPDSNEI